jgi:uncharacterized protein DUF6152
MKSKLLVASFAGAGLLVVSGPMFAHHSAAIYDRDHMLTLTGVVTVFSFANPHVEIRFDVTDDKGNTEEWIAESGPPNRLYRAGWTAKTLKPGDRITVTGAPLKDGRKLLSIKKLEGVSVPTLGVGAE